MLVKVRTIKSLGVAHEKIPPKNQFRFSLMTMRQLGKTSLQIDPKCFQQAATEIIKRNFLVTDCLMPSDKSNLIMAKAMARSFHCSMSLQLDTCLLAYRSTYNAFFMGLPVSSFVSHSSLLTVKGVDLAVACGGFPS